MEREYIVVVRETRYTEYRVEAKDEEAALEALQEGLEPACVSHARRCHVVDASHGENASPTL